MKVLDGLNPHEVPFVTEIDDAVIANCEKYEDTEIRITRWGDVVEDKVTIYCLIRDGLYIPCVSACAPSPLFPRKREYEFILCAAYKTRRGFDNWLRRMQPTARKVA